MCCFSVHCGPDSSLCSNLVMCSCAFSLETIYPGLLLHIVYQDFFSSHELFYKIRPNACPYFFVSDLNYGDCPFHNVVL